MHGELTVAQALGLVAVPPPVDKLVVCQGDACAPNTLLSDDGHWSGHVDLGVMGVADRWADLAVATWSTEWNYGPGWEADLLDGLRCRSRSCAHSLLQAPLGPRSLNPLSSGRVAGFLLPRASFPTGWLHEAGACSNIAGCDLGPCSIEAHRASSPDIRVTTAW